MTPVEIVTEALMDALSLVSDHDVIQGIQAELDWPAEGHPEPVWVLDGDSPRSLAEKIVAALADPSWRYQALEEDG